jgi:hypothetical protein
MCQLFISKDFETSLLTLLGVSLVLWRRKADNAHSNPLFYGPRPLTSQHLHFQFLIVTLLKIFVRSRRDWKKKCREGSRQAHSNAQRATTAFFHFKFFPVKKESLLALKTNFILSLSTRVIPAQKSIPWNRNLGSINVYKFGL